MLRVRRAANQVMTSDRPMKIEKARHRDDVGFAGLHQRPSPPLARAVGDAVVVVRVRPAHVDQDQHPGRDDDQHAEQRCPD